MRQLDSWRISRRRSQCLRSYRTFRSRDTTSSPPDSWPETGRCPTRRSTSRCREDRPASRGIHSRSSRTRS